MASAQVVETSVNNNSPSQDSNHPDDLFQSRYNIVVGSKIIFFCTSRIFLYFCLVRSFVCASVHVHVDVHVSEHV